MSSIKPRIGTCIDCGPGTEDKYLMAKRCFSGPHFHYQKHQQAKSKKKPNQVKQAEKKKTLGRWFNEQIGSMPRQCENCGEYLNPYAPWSSRAYIAHIVPKRHFVSVMVHPLNRWFGCIDCHTKYDNSLSKEVVEMPVYSIVVERFRQFVEEIDPSELRHLAPFLQDIAAKNEVKH